MNKHEFTIKIQFDENFIIINNPTIIKGNVVVLDWIGQKECIVYNLDSKKFREVNTRYINTQLDNDNEISNDDFIGLAENDWRTLQGGCDRRIIETNINIRRFEHQ